MPASVEVQQAWLLFNLKDDRDLYRTLMHLGDRADLTTEQRRTVQTIWASWSVRRASNDIKAGNTRLAIEILTSARQAFPGNPDVSKALAGGYLQAGQPKQQQRRRLRLHGGRGAGRAEYEACRDVAS